MMSDAPEDPAAKLEHRREAIAMAADIGQALAWLLERSNLTKSQKARARRDLRRFRGQLVDRAGPDVEVPPITFERAPVADVNDDDRADTASFDQGWRTALEVAASVVASASETVDTELADLPGPQRALVRGLLLGLSTLFSGRATDPPKRTDYE